MTAGPDRPLLAIDTSTDTGTVAVGTREGLLSEVALNVRSGHSSNLLPAVDRAVESAGLRPADLGGVVVGGGPGSFTGLRIAAATAKGIVKSLELPLYAYSSLLATAAQAWATDGPVCALIDARGRDVFAATYRFRPAPTIVDPPAIATIDDVVERFAGRETPVFVGTGTVRHREEIAARTGAIVADPHFGVPRAGALVWLAFGGWPDGRVDDPSAWQPEYLRPSGAERIAAARAAGGVER